MADATRRSSHAECRSGAAPGEEWALTLVIDANVAVAAGLLGRWTERLASEKLVAPTLLWSEITASLRQLEWRADVTPQQVDNALDWLRPAAIATTSSSELMSDACRLARRLGWGQDVRR